MTQVQLLQNVIKGMHSIPTADFHKAHDLLKPALPNAGRDGTVIGKQLTHHDATQSVL